MLRLLQSVLIVLLTGTIAFSQDADTLKVLVLSPYNTVVPPNVMQEYKAIDIRMRETRSELKLQALRDKQEHAEEYKEMPWYNKQMYQNDLTFLDNLDFGNSIARITRDYIDRRLAKPFKIKPRLVMVSAQTAPSKVAHYKSLVQKKGYDYIISFPLVTYAKDANDNITATTTTEVYSSAKDAIVFTRQLTGKCQAKPGYDIVSCNNGSIDCALLNSVYDNYYPMLKIIAGVSEE